MPDKPKSNLPQAPSPLDVDRAALAEQTTKQLAKQPKTLKDNLRSKEFEAAVAAVLPKAMSAPRVIRIALMATTRNPDLLNCSQSSLFRCVLDCCAYGLEPDGRRAHLIPFKNNKMCQCGHGMDAHRGQECSKCECKQRRTLVECTLIIDYKGLAELARRSREVSYIHADVVYEKDEWSYAYGTEAHLRHKPNSEDRGTKRVAYYSYVRLKDGGEDFVVLNPAEVEAVRKSSKAPDSPAWKNWYDEMGKKTAFRRHSKWLPLSPEVRDAVEHDDVAIDATSAWDDMVAPAVEIEEGEGEAQPTTLRDHVLGQANLLEDDKTGGQEPQP